MTQRALLEARLDGMSWMIVVTMLASSLPSGIVERFVFIRRSDATSRWGGTAMR